MQVTFEHSQEVAANIRTFWFRPSQPIRYTAGQFTQLRLPDDHPDDRGDKRWFTLSSSPTEALVSITTKFALENGSSFKNTLKSLQPGTVVDMAEPMGDFVLPKDATIPLAFVAGGIGVTPCRSMVKYLLDTHEKRDMTLIYALDRLEEVAFRNIFEAYDLKFILVPKNPPAGWTHGSGLLDASKVLSLISEPARKLIYLSGPTPMIEGLEKELVNKGVNKNHLVTDLFLGYPGV